VSRFYITTPIYYINAEPHLGHAYSTMVADAAARAHRLMGDDVFFLTGTDEHGQKVERAAKKAGVPTPAFADTISQKFRDLSPLLDISNDDFIRTTEPRHFRAAQELWRRVKERGFIYKGSYEGWYCTVDEVFVPDTQLVDGKCPTCGSVVERIAEESYFFKLSAFQDRLRDYYAQHPDFVTPPGRRNEIVAFIESGLQDLSVSRTSFTWGIPVPDDPAHVMYVWFDALTNYMTAVGYGSADAGGAVMFARYWPADVHLIGKEIVRQHGIYWPAFLMAADLPVPRKLVSHGWWLMDGAKMSKSIGNVVKPADYVRQFGVDGLRYFVMREMVFGQDANFTDEAVLGRYNADLANDLGNLVSRAATMIHRYCESAVPRANTAMLARTPEVELQAGIDNLIGRVKSAVETFQFSQALRDIWEVIGATNRYIVTREPWVLAKDAAKRDELDTALYVAADTVRVVGELVRPFMPGTGERMLAMVGVTPSPQSWVSLRTGELMPGSRLGETHALFPRIEHSVEELRKMSSDAQKPEESLAPAAPLEPVAPLEPPAPLAPAAPPEPLDPRIAIEDFMKVELRVAKVLAAERVPKSKKLLKLQVDVGTEQRTLVAGIAEAYEPEAIVGRSVVIVFNLKPAKLMGIESNGMVLAASPDGGKPMLVSFDEPPAPGTRVR
jgi:methionyl-tRNA synthetase